MRLFSFALSIALLIASTACSDTRPETATDSTLEQSIEAFHAETLRNLEQMDKEFDNLEGRIADTSEDTRHMLREVLAELRIQHRKLHQDLERLDATDEKGLHYQQRVITLRLHELESKLEAATFDAVESREIFQEIVEVRLDELDRELATLEQQIVDTTSVISDETLTALRQQHENINQQVNQLEEASELTFRELRSELAWSVARLGTRIEVAAERMEQARDEKETVLDQVSL